MVSRKNVSSAAIIDFPSGDLDFSLLNGAGRCISRSLNINDTIEHILDTLQVGLEPQVCGIIAVHKDGTPRYDSAIRGLRAAEEARLETQADIAHPGWRDKILDDRLATWYERDLNVSPAAQGLLVAGWTDKRPLSRSEYVFLETLRFMASLAIENCLLHDEEERSAVTRDRARIARELHDGLAQSLYSMALQIKVCQKLLYKNPEAVEDKLNQLERLANEDISEVRRRIADLNAQRPARNSLVTAVRTYVDKFAKLQGLSGSFQATGREANLPSEVIDNLYYVVREGLSNTAKHAGAENFKVNMEFGIGEVELRIADDGRGFVVPPRAAARKRTGLGLRNIEERIELLGGYLQILSRPGCGTQIIAVAPYDTEASGRDRL